MATAVIYVPPVEHSYFKDMFFAASILDHLFELFLFVPEEIILINITSFYVGIKIMTDSFLIQFTKVKASLNGNV